MTNKQEIKQYVSFSQEDFSSDMKNNIVHGTDSTGKTVAVDTWKYARYFFDKIQRKDISKKKPISIQKWSDDRKKDEQTIIIL